MSTPTAVVHNLPIVMVSEVRPDTIHFHSVEMEEYDENNESHYAASNNIFRTNGWQCLIGWQKCKRCVKEYPRSICGMVIFVFCVITILLPLLLISGKTCVLPMGYTTPFQPPPMANNKINGDDPFNVILFGDSLIANPFNGYDLGGKIQSYLPKYSVQFLNYGVGGNKIRDMYHRLPSILEVMRTRPIHAIMLLWDSDVSDVDEASMSPQQIISLRDYYRSNITFIIESLRQQQPDLYISMAGPVLLGEGQNHFLSPVSQEKFDQKQLQLDAYVRINLEMATWLEIPYVNLREAYHSVLPWYRLAYDSCLTLDGEHPNSNGAYVTAKSFASVLDEWLRESYDNPMKPF